MSRLRAAWSTWVALWSLTEHPRSLAAIRVGLGVVMLWDLGQLGALGLVEPLMALEGHGGLSATLRGSAPAPWAVWAPPGPGAAWALYAGMLGATALFTLGLLARPAMVAFVLLSAQWEWQLPEASRGIEALIRIVLLILACSECDRWLSLRALRETGSVWGRGEPVPAWPRHLVIAQLVLMYFLAGVQKFGLDWSPAHGFSALYLILQDPAVARVDFGWAAREPWLSLTRVGTAVTIAWEWATPLLLVAWWYRFTPERGGAIRAFVRRWRPELGWVAVGVVFHAAIAATLALGIFPFAMLACYFAFLHPDELRRVTRR